MARTLTAVRCDMRGHTMTALNVEAKIANRTTGEVRTDRQTGLPLWGVDTYVINPSGDGALMTVTIPSATRPEVTGPCEFDDLVASQYAISNEGGGVTAGMAFRATAIRAAQPSRPGAEK